MSFTIVVPFFNGHKYIERLLDSIPETIPFVLVDDKSDNLPNVDRPNVKVILSEKKGYFTGAVNRGIEACNTDVLVLNQDTYFTGDKWLNFIDRHKAKYGLFGERAGTHPAWPGRYVHGTFMYIRRDVIDKVGLLNEEYYPHWGSTCEYQLRACRKGFKVLPAEKVPDFVHVRQGPYGSATQQALTDGEINQHRLIRTPPAISVIITCFNYGKYLNDAVNSLIGGQTSLGKTDGQTFQSFEIIIVDDGSEDDSVEIGQSLADPYKGIHFVSQANAGSAAAMNAGIIASHARSGHLIAPLDADDMMKPQRLERMLRLYEDNHHSVIYDNIQYFAHGQEGLTNWETSKKYDVLDLGTYDFEQIIEKNRMHKGLLYPKRAWEGVGGYAPAMNKGREDWAFNVGLGIKGWCGINTGEADYLYRREGQNRTLTNTTPRWRRKFLNQLKSLYPDIYAGERPMGCCSGGKRRAPSKKGSVAVVKKNLPGKTGMVILEYLGGNAGTETWRGPVTSTKYVFGGKRKRGYVDRLDAKEMIQPIRGGIEAGKVVFKIVEPEKPRPIEKPKPVEITEPEKPKSIERPEEIIKTPKIIVEADPIDYPTLTVSKLKELLPTLTTTELDTVLQQERAGKNRITAIKAIEDEWESRLA